MNSLARFFCTFHGILEITWPGIQTIQYTFETVRRITLLFSFEKAFMTSRQLDSAIYVDTGAFRWFIVFLTGVFSHAVNDAVFAWRSGYKPNMALSNSNLVRNHLKSSGIQLNSNVLHSLILSSIFNGLKTENDCVIIQTDRLTYCSNCSRNNWNFFWVDRRWGWAGRYTAWSRIRSGRVGRCKIEIVGRGCRNPWWTTLGSVRRRSVGCRW